MLGSDPAQAQHRTDQKNEHGDQQQDGDADDGDGPGPPH